MTGYTAKAQNGSSGFEGFGEPKRPKRLPKGSALDAGGPEVSNALLAALPPADLQRLMPALEVVPLPLKQILHRTGEPID